MPDRLLQGGEIRAAEVGSGSASDIGASDLTAGKLPTKLSDRIVDVGGRQDPTHSSRRINRRPVIPVAKGGPNGCSFRETRAHVRSPT